MRAEPKTHEVNLRELRSERRGEEKKLLELKARLEEALALSKNPPTLFAVHPTGQINAA